MAVSTAIPVIVVFFHLFIPAGAIWQHLFATVLGDYLSNSLLLVAGTSVGVLLIGVPSAWFTTMCNFPGRNLFRWMLLLPLSIPTYIIAYTYTGIFDVSGWVQVSIREVTGWQYGEYSFIQIRSLGGAVVMFSLTLYPYVYLLSRATFISQSVSALEVGQSLGLNRWQNFVRIAIPLARPGIIAGLSLALMETLADFGTVQYFGIQTFTTGIYRTWFGLGESAAASQLAAVLMIFTFVLLVAERISRHRLRFYASNAREKPLPEYQLRGKLAFFVSILCALPVLVGFVIPALQLLYWSLITAETLFDSSFIELVINSLLLALTAAILVVGLAIVLGYAKRATRYRSIKIVAAIASMGYSIPGIVIAIGVYVPFIWFDRTIQQLFASIFDVRVGLVVTGTIIVVLFAYNVRFLAVSLGSIDSGFAKITPVIDDAGRSLGLSHWGVLLRIHLPIMKGAILTALLLVIVDVLKELPATLILRPFDLSTLAIYAYEMASEERLADTGLPSLLIVLCGIIPVILLSRLIGQARSGYTDKDS